MSGFRGHGHHYGDIHAQNSHVHLGDDLSTHHNSFVFNDGQKILSEADVKAGKYDTAVCFAMLI